MDRPSVPFSVPTQLTVYIEEVGSRTGHGITSSFTFGRGFSILIGVCEALGIPYELIRPQAWQNQFGLNTGIKDKAKKKQQIADHCIRLYPDTNLTGPRGGLRDGRSDAILLVALYRWLILQQAAA